MTSRSSRKLELLASRRERACCGPQRRGPRARCAARPWPRSPGTRCHASAPSTHTASRLGAACLRVDVPVRSRSPSGCFRAQFATGGLAVLAGGAGLALLRSASKLAWDSMVRRCVVRAEFDSRDDSYRWLVLWLASHPHYAGTKRFSVLTSLRRLGASSMETDSLAQGQGGAGVMLVPSGTSLMRHRGHWIVVERNQEDDSKQSAASGRERETLTLHIIGGDKAYLFALIAEAKKAFSERERARTAVYFIDEYGSWNRVSSKPARPGSSVILHQPGQVCISYVHYTHAHAHTLSLARTHTHTHARPLSLSHARTHTRSHGRTHAHAQTVALSLSALTPCITLSRAHTCTCSCMHAHRSRICLPTVEDFCSPRRGTASEEFRIGAATCYTALQAQERPL